MKYEKTIHILEALQDTLREMPMVASVRVERPYHVDSLRVVIELAFECVEYWKEGAAAHAFLPREGVVSDLRALTNPLRRFCRGKEVDFVIETPNRHYVSRKATCKDFVGYSSPEVILNIL